MGQQNSSGGCKRLLLLVWVLPFGAPISIQAQIWLAGLEYKALCQLCLPLHTLKSEEPS